MLYGRNHVRNGIDLALIRPNKQASTVPDFFRIEDYSLFWATDNAATPVGKDAN